MKTKQSNLKSHWGKKKKYIMLNLTKEVRDLDVDNYNTLIKVNENDSNKGRTPHALGMDVLISSKRLYYSKPTTNFILSLSKYP